MIIHHADNYKNDCENGTNCTVCFGYQIAISLLYCFVVVFNYLVMLQLLKDTLQASETLRYSNSVINFIEIFICIPLLLLQIIRFLQVKGRYQVFILRNDPKQHLCASSLEDDQGLDPIIAILVVIRNFCGFRTVFAQNVSSELY